MQLTEHFTLEEFERSGTAARLHIDNRVPEALVPNIRHLCEEALEPLREHFGEPVFISSGYRSPELNKAVGGVQNSQHMRGEAADICPVINGRPDSTSPEARKKMREWAEWIMDNLHFDQLLREHSGDSYWIHVSLKRGGENRQQVKQMGFDP